MIRYPVEGYHTAIVGKWHLGFDESRAIDPLADSEKEINP